MTRIFWSDEETRDLHELHRDDFLARYPHRGLNAWKNKRTKEGLHTNPAFAADGTPWPRANQQASPVMPEEVPQRGAQIGAAGYTDLTPPTITNVVGVTAGEPIDIEDAIARHERQFQKVARSHERKRQQHVYLSGSPAMVALFSDQHCGSPHTDLRRMFDEQRMVMQTPGAYVALGGDVTDNYTIGKLMAQNMFHTVEVREEWQIAKRYIEGFGDRLLWVHSGNHQQWSTRLIGVDIDRSITPDGVLYDQDEILVNLHIGPHTYLIRSRHKWGGDSMYNPTHGLERAARFDNAAPDIFIGAHVHKGALVRSFVLGGKRKTAILTGTYKGTSDTYARQEGFPAHNGSTGVAIIFFPDGEYHAFDSIPAACHVMKALYRQAA